MYSPSFSIALELSRVPIKRKRSRARSKTSSEVHSNSPRHLSVSFIIKVFIFRRTPTPVFIIATIHASSYPTPFRFDSTSVPQLGFSS